MTTLPSTRRDPTAPSGPTCADPFRPGGPRRSWASSSTGAPTPSPPGPSRAAPWARCPSRTGSGTTRTPSGTATRSGSPAARRPSTTGRSTGMRRTTTSSTPGPPNGSTRPRGPSCSPRPAPATSSPPRSTTTASRCGTPRAPAPATPCTADPAGTWSGRSRTRSGRSGCGSGSTTPAGWTGPISNFPPHQTSAEVHDLRPVDAAYNAYALLHVRDLIERYDPADPVERHRLARRRQAHRRLVVARALHRLLRRPPRRGGERPLGRHALGLPDHRVLRGHRAGVRGPVGELPRDRLLVRLQPGRGNRPAADRPPAGPAARRPRVPGRAPAAQRRTDRRRGDSGRPAGVAARTRPLDLRPR